MIRAPTGEQAVTLEEKDKAVRDFAFHPPSAGAPADLQESGKAYKTTTKEVVCETIMDQSVKKAPGPDRLTFHPIRLIWELDGNKVVELIQACIRTGIHPQAWKTGK